ncbi:MAG: M6 family metalloprotease domain-containing protein [Prevotella sp.]|nr:M6 family metalloprotease domain-containing protein [Prevotella sp.]
MTVLLLLTTATMLAAPARRGQWQWLTLADGKQVWATLIGDEYGHAWSDQQGTLYAETAQRGIYQTIDIHTFNSHQEARRTQRNASRARYRQRAKAYNGFSNYTGKKRGLIILVNFADTKLQPGNDSAFYCRMANEEGFDEGDFDGSLRDYFFCQSNNQFDITFDVVGPVTVSEGYAYYGKNLKNGDDERAEVMIMEACQLADSLVYFSDYDWDGDGEVENFYVIYAGRGESDGGDSETIWAHQWDLKSSPYGEILELDGVLINTYACGQELAFDDKAYGIGLICHEFSHCLGLPDFYNTNTGSSSTLAQWSLMDYGIYNNNAYTPCNFTAYERWQCGWANPIELTGDSLRVEGMVSQDAHGDCYVYFNPADSTETLLISYIRKEGWDTYAKGEGLMVMHVDYDKKKWEENTPNNDKNQECCTLFLCKSRNGVNNARATDLWTDGNTFSRDSNNPCFYHPTEDDETSVGLIINDIVTADDGTISFTVKKEAPVTSIRHAPRASGTNGTGSGHNAVYSLSGQRLTSPCPGINILNGKKIAVRRQYPPESRNSRQSGISDPTK